MTDTVFSPDPEHLYLTATGRLARRCIHNYRKQNINNGTKGWESLKAMTLNAWLEKAWIESWPDMYPAPYLTRIILWNKLAAASPPDSIEITFNLCRMLDETYGTLIRHKINPETGHPAAALVEWRRNICSSFRQDLLKEGMFHPSELSLRVSNAITNKKITCPSSLSLLAFDSPAPVEHDLFRLFESQSQVTYNTPASQTESKIEAVLLPSPKQEIQYLVHRLAIDAQTTPLHRIGVIIPDMKSYAQKLVASLEDITGKHLPQNRNFYNITLGIPFSETALAHAAFLPFRFISENFSRERFLSLILSPYYGCWQGKHHDIARADRIWRSCAIDNGLDALMDCLKRKSSELFQDIFSEKVTFFLEFCKQNLFHTATASSLLSSIQKLWKSLDFPVISDEKDTVDARHLEEIVAECKAELSDMSINGHKLISLMHHAASARISQISSSEHAGIQIMGLLESRGLDFDKLYVLDMNDRSFPRPVRPLPLLDSQERRQVQGGTAESQYEFARNLFSRLQTSAPIITLLRAEQDDGKPLTKSPFWPPEEIRESVDLYNNPGPSWLRAEWLKSAFNGLQHFQASHVIPIHDNSISRIGILPKTLSVSQIKTAFTCPFQFFSSVILKLEPLEKIHPFVSPKDRGIRLHSVLSAFTKRIRARHVNLSHDQHTAHLILEECVDEVLKDVSLLPRWSVERKIWLDEKTLSGLLNIWLQTEIDHSAQGWECIAEEIPFRQLSEEGWPFLVKGRIDRIDYHPDYGLCCWDYKTGNIPSNRDIVKFMTEPQMPLYLLALRKGFVDGLPPTSLGTLASLAGYIQLKSLKEAKTHLIDSLESSLDILIKKVAAIGTDLYEGRFSPEPFPLSEQENSNTVCDTCPFICLCQKGILQNSKKRESNDSDSE